MQTIHSIKTDYLAISSEIVNKIFKQCIEKTVDRCISAKWGFRRMTFIEQDKCYICDKYFNNISVIKLDSFLGSNLYGWLTCNDCKQYVMMFKQIKEKNMNCIPQGAAISGVSTLPGRHETRTIRFWRESSDKKITPYLVTDATFDTENGDIFSYKDKYDTLSTCVGWNYNTNDVASYSKNALVKYIPLANLIFHNRDFFGYDNTEFQKKILNNSEYSKDIKWLSKWNNRSENQYTIANSWLIFYKLCYRNNIPREIILHILRLWGMFSLHKYSV